MENIFLQLAVVLSFASLLGFIVLKLKMPLIVAYLLSGVVLATLSIFDVSHSLVLDQLPELGVALVLFLIGMELDLREIKTLGVPIICSAIGQIIISTLLGWALATMLGFGVLESVYLGVGLAFSSTVVVIKILLEKKDLASLYGKLSLGILLVEDIIAIIALIIISVGSSALTLGSEQTLNLLLLLAKALGLFLVTFILSRYVLEKVFDAVARSVELLFFTAMTWCFVFTSIAVLLNLSVVIGAFLAGVALASSPYHLQIQGKIKPLRDFFLTLFFVYLGSQVRLQDIQSSWQAIVLFTAFAVVMKPLLYLIILGFFGFRKHTLFQTALNLSQISEFSLIILVIGQQLGVTSQLALSVMAAVGVVSITTSSVAIQHSKRLFKIISPILGLFEHKTRIHKLESQVTEKLEDHIIVIGAHRVGGPVVSYLRHAKIPFLVMDFNPHTVGHLRDLGVKVLYGDVGDPEVVEGLNVEKARLIISTANSMDDNEMLLEECRRRKTKATIVVRAEDPLHAEALKVLGADYVILPEKVSGDFLVAQLKNHWPSAHFKGLN